MSPAQENIDNNPIDTAADPTVSWVHSGQPLAIERGRQVAVLFGIDPGSPQGKALLTLLQVMSIDVRLVAPDQLNQTVGFSAAIPGARAATRPCSETAPDVQLLLMRDLKDDLINELLKQIRDSEAGPIRLKAVVTAHNQDWTLLDLIKELEEEHAMMGAYNRLRQSMQIASNWLGADDGDAEKSAALRQLLAKASDLISGSEPPPVASMQALDREIRALL